MFDNHSISLVVNGESIPCVGQYPGMRPVGDGDVVLSGAGLQKISALVRFDRSLVPQIPQIGAIKDFQPDEGKCGLVLILCISSLYRIVFNQNKTFYLNLTH